MKIQFERFFSVDSPKAIKAAKFNYLNAINYMAPANSAGVGNLCTHASLGCIALCLGRESGQAAMVSKATGTNAVRDSRERKARYFMSDRQSYLREMLLHIARNVRRARVKGMALAVRPNGSTDIAYEGLRIIVDNALARQLTRIAGCEVTAGTHTIFSAFPSIQYLDYTKNPNRLRRTLPANYHLTFSLSETNLDQALAALARGFNVAVVFAVVPATWRGFAVIDGDQHDLRHLDPRAVPGACGVVVGLSPKGLKAKRDTSGFVQRCL
jgi:hypothetical protein